MTHTTTRSTLRHALQTAGFANRFHDHIPHWRIEEFQPGHWWIYDGDLRVGLALRDGQDVAELLNTDPLRPETAISFPALYHAPTMLGDRVTMAMWLNGPGTKSDFNELSFATNADGVTAFFRENWNDGRRASKKLCWRLDADFGYVLSVEAKMSVPYLEQHAPNKLPEHCNFLPRGATDDRPESARYPYVLWQHPLGKIVRWNQNNVGARALGALGVHDRRLLKDSGFIGFFGESDRDIALEILQSSPVSTALTCPQMLDERVMWAPPEVEAPPQNESGDYCYQAAYNLVAVPPPVSADLTAQAELLDGVLDRTDAVLEARHHWCAAEYPQVAGAPKNLRLCTLAAGTVADFETRLDAAAGFRGLVFPYPDDADAPISVVSDGAHSGMHSLRLQPDGQALRAAPMGACLHVTAGQRYRLSAWLKTELTSGAAQLSAIEFQFSLAHITATHRSTPVRGQADWQKVAVEFTPGENAHVVDAGIEADGRGRVWADDILLEKIG